MKQQNTMVSFCKIKKGGFFRSIHTTKQLYQKFDKIRAQVVCGPHLGKVREFPGEQVIPVAAKITW
jgi:hypothetical protein